MVVVVVGVVVGGGGGDFQENMVTYMIRGY